MGLFKKLFRKLFKKKSNMELWAEREIAIAIKREHEADRKDAEEHGRKYNPKDFSYGGEIYASALRAFKSMLKDGHSGCSWGFTKETLIRLMNHRPLTPLTGSDDEWVECGWASRDGEKIFQNKRCSAVFKNVDKDGNVRYTDNDYSICIDEENKYCHHFGLSSNEVDKLFPIKFPYMPSTKPYKVYDRTFDHLNAEPGCFDTIAVLRIECPDGKVIPIDKFYKENENGKMVQIERNEYLDRLDSYNKKSKRNVQP